MSRRVHAALALALCALLAFGCAPRPRPEPRPEPEPPRRRVETRMPPLVLTLDLPAGTLEAGRGYRASATIANENVRPYLHPTEPKTPVVTLRDSEGKAVWTNAPVVGDSSPPAADRTLGPGESASATFTLTLPESGRYTLTASSFGLMTPPVPLEAKAP